MAGGYGYHVCAGCRRAQKRAGLRFPLTCDCGHVSTRPRVADFEPWEPDAERPREAVSLGGYQVSRAPLLDE